MQGAAGDGGGEVPAAVEAGLYFEPVEGVAGGVGGDFAEVGEVGPVRLQEYDHRYDDTGHSAHTGTRNKIKNNKQK